LPFQQLQGILNFKATPQRYCTRTHNIPSYTILQFNFQGTTLKLRTHSRASHHTTIHGKTY